jgi:peptide/nickel transport system ATP-binding protein
MMAVMQAGKIVEFGPSETIYRLPKQQYTRDLIAAAPKDDLENIRRRQKEREAALARRVGVSPAS